MSENSEPQTEPISDLEGIDPEKALEVLEGPAQGEPVTDEKGGSPSTPVELSNRLQRLKVDVTKLPEPIQNSPEALEIVASSLEEREKDFQRGFTQKTMELGQKARAFELLQESPAFQNWVDNYMNPQPTSTNEDQIPDPPEGLEGKALLHWFIEQGVSRGVAKELEKRGIPQSIQGLSRSVSETQKSMLYSKYPDFQDLEPEIYNYMTEYNVNAEKAYKMVKADKVTPDTMRNDIRKEIVEQIKAQLAEVKPASAVISGSRGSSLGREEHTPSRTLDEAIQKAWEEAG